jgi:hypothetical protein
VRSSRRTHPVLWATNGQAYQTSYRNLRRCYLWPSAPGSKVGG